MADKSYQEPQPHPRPECGTCSTGASCYFEAIRKKIKFSKYEIDCIRNNRTFPVYFAPLRYHRPNRKLAIWNSPSWSGLSRCAEVTWRVHRRRRATRRRWYRVFASCGIGRYFVAPRAAIHILADF